jgi:mono/diheme cytochrome c family protein
MNRTKQMPGLPVTALLVLAVTALGAEPAAAAEGDAAKVARGKYLVTTSGCHDCHTPWHDGPSGPEPDMSRMLSGHPESMVITEPAALPKGPWIGATAITNTAFTGPWGVSFTANLTPDRNTGIGIWTEEMFIKTIRTGRHWGVSRPILPPMPWFNYRHMTDEDLKAVFAYLRSIPPVVNHVPEPIQPVSTTN